MGKKQTISTEFGGEYTIKRKRIFSSDGYSISIKDAIRILAIRKVFLDWPRVQDGGLQVEAIKYRRDYEDGSQSEGDTTQVTVYKGSFVPDCGAIEIGCHTIWESEVVHFERILGAK